MVPTLTAALLALVTIVDRGLVFQPALSPDGAMVAYAADDGGQVSIHIAPAAGGAPAKVASVGAGVEGRRLAAAALLHQPWSEDGRLLYLAPDPEAGTALHVYAAGESKKLDTKLGPGLIESASFVAGGRIIFTHRTSRTARTQRVVAIDATSGATEDIYTFEKDDVAVDAAPAPNGAWIAAIVLSGPRDERTRSLQVIDARGKRAQRLAERIAVNFLAWSSDSRRLFYVDTVNAELGTWLAGTAETLPGAPGVAMKQALPVLDGSIALASDAEETLAAIVLETHERRALGAGYVATSTAGGKVALLRRGAEGAGIFVADVTRDALLSGDIGLPKPPPPAPPPGTPPGGESPAKEEEGKVAPASPQEGTTPPGVPPAAPDEQ